MKKMRSMKRKKGQLPAADSAGNPMWAREAEGQRRNPATKAGNLYARRPEKWAALVLLLICIVIIAICLISGKSRGTEKPLTAAVCTPVSPFLSASPDLRNETPDSSKSGIFVTEMPSAADSARPDRTPTAGTPEGGSTVPPTPTQKPEVLSQKHRAFTETEAFIDEMYHGLFPERTDYIAYWTDEGKMFWAPDIENLFPSHSYTMYSGVEYDIIANGETNLFLFVEPQSLIFEKILYCGRFSADENERVGQRFTSGVFTELQYQIFYYGDTLYMGAAFGYIRQSEAWYAQIIEIKTLQSVWEIKRLYPNASFSEESAPETCYRWYKEVFTEQGMILYRVKPPYKMSPEWEYDKEYSYEELLG